MISKVSDFLFEKEYQLNTLIQGERKQHFLLRELIGRVYALTISLFSLINLLFDSFYILGHTLAALGWSVVHLENPLKYCSSVVNIAVTASEFFRHLGGAIAGTAIGLFMPRLAAELFLPSDQTAKETSPSNISVEQAEKIYEMAGVIHELFEANGIPYCMYAGTQLGAARHGGLIPWDDDADLFVLEEDKEKIRGLKEQFENRGIGIIECTVGFEGMKFFDLNGVKKEERYGDKIYQYQFPFIDISYATREDGRVHMTSETARTKYPGEYLTEEEWEGRTLQQFGSVQLYGAPDPERFCKRMYGESVFVYGYQMVDHLTGGWKIPRKFYLRKEDDGRCKPLDLSAKGSA